MRAVRVEVRPRDLRPQGALRGEGERDRPHAGARREVGAAHRRRGARRVRLLPDRRGPRQVQKTLVGWATSHRNPNESVELFEKRKQKFAGSL